MASKTLTATVKFNTSSAEKSLARLSKKINDVQNAIKKTSSNNTKLTKELNKATSATNKMNTAANKVANTTNKIASTTRKVTNATRQASDQAKSLGRSYRSANGSANTLLSTVKKLSAAYLGVEGARMVMNTSDIITKAQNKFKNTDGIGEELTQATMDKIYAASQRSRSGYGDMLSNVSKSMTLAPDAFQGNVDNAIRFQEIMAKSYTVGGASAAEQASSMYQLMQALGSGKLQGDELRSVAEGAPLAYKQIEKHVQSLMATNEETAKYATMSLKDIAAEGLVTSAMVVDSIMASEEKITEAFNNTEMTFEQVWEGIKNTATKAFEPTLITLNKILNHPVTTKLFQVFGMLLSFVGNVVNFVFGIFLGLFNWLADNWDWLSKVILSVLAVIAVYFAVTLFPQFIAWIQYIAFVVAYYVWLAATSVASALKTAAAWAIANWQLLLIILIIAAVIVAVIWLADSFEDAIGMIVGGIMTAVAFVWNLFLSLVDLVLGILNIFWNQFAAFANFFGNVFSDPIGSIIHLFGDMADTVLGIVETIASAIDKLFGSNLADAVAGWRGSLDAKITATAEKYGNGKYEEKVDKANLTAESLGLERWSYTDAYNTGYEWGSTGAAWVSDKLGGLLGGLPDANDDQYKVDDSYKMLEGINGNTEDIKDAMDLTDDDLEFLRKVAEMEWRNEFTTAEIRVDMTNNNTVTAERDLDGIVEYLSDVLREEMTSVANGVHY